MRRSVVLSAVAFAVACTPGASEPPPAVPQAESQPLPAPSPPVATTTTSAASTPVQEVPAPRDDGRLPALATPTRYVLSLDIDPTKPRFRGEVTIEIDVPRATSHVVLHGQDLAITDVAATIGSKALNGTASKRPSHGTSEADELVLSFPEPLPAGRASLSLTYDAPFAPDLAGLYRVKEGERWYAFTQFESTSARRAFPCFDEPGFKVPFDLTITAPKGMIAVANNPEAARTEDAGKVRFEFGTSKPLPTYLLAFAIGDFDVRDGSKAPVPIRLVTVKGKAGLGDAALTATEGLVAKLGEYFAIPYPFPKLDIVAVPDFAAGAMENPGLITFREALLLHDPKHTSVHDRRMQTVVIAHELAHIWFGDLVTMQWWNDVWLNEGFASWMETKASDMWRPDLDLHLDAVSDAQNAMETDALASARAVRQAVTSPGEIEEAFDDIAYQKGAAVLSMLEGWMGPRAFQKGVREYIKAHSWKNATAEDLLGALDQASGKDVTGLAGTFLDRPGVPTVAVKATCGAGKTTLDLSQWAWHPVGIAAKPSDGVPWRVPVCARASAGESECADLGAAHGSLELKTAACPAWVLPNVGAAGYYRSALTEADVWNLARAQSRLDVPNRIGLISDLWAQVRAGTLAPNVMLDVLPLFDHETDGHVVSAIIDVLYDVSRELIEDGSRWAYRGYVQARMASHKARLTWWAKANDDDDAAMLRPKVLQLLGDVGRDRDTLREAEALTKVWLRDPTPIDPDVAPVALRLSSLHAGPARVDELLKAARAAKTPGVRIAALGALSTFEEPAARESALNAVLTDDVRMQDLRYVFGRRSEQHVRTDASKTLFAWIASHWEAIRMKAPGVFGAQALVSVVGGTCSIAERDAEVGFFQSHAKELEGAQRALYEYAEGATSCAELRTRSAGAVTAYFKK